MDDPITRTLAVEAVAARLRQKVLSGEVGPGDRLPGERELAQQYGVNRLTVRHAVARLATQGLVSVRQGDGIRAANFLRDGALEILIDLFAAVRGGPRMVPLLRDLLELRRIVAADVVALACARRTVEHLKALQARVDDLATLLAARAARRDVRAVEIQFSQTLVDATGNIAFQLLFNTIHRFLASVPDLVDAAPVEPQMLLTGYETMLKTIRSGNADEARALTLAVIGAFDEAVLERLAASGRRTRAAKSPSSVVRKARPR